MSMVCLDYGRRDEMLQAMRSCGLHGFISLRTRLLKGDIVWFSFTDSFSFLQAGLVEQKPATYHKA